MRLRSSRRIAALAGAGMLVAMIGVAGTGGPASAEQVGTQTWVVTCTTNIGLEQDQEITLTVIGPDEVLQGSTFQLQVPGGDATLPATGGGYPVMGYADLGNSYTIAGAGATMVPGSITVDGDAYVVSSITRNNVMWEGVSYSFVTGETYMIDREAEILPGNTELALNLPGLFPAGELHTPSTFVTVNVPDGTAGQSITVSGTSFTTTAILRIGGQNITVAVTCEIPPNTLLTIPVVETLSTTTTTEPEATTTTTEPEATTTTTEPEATTTTTGPTWPSGPAVSVGDASLVEGDGGKQRVLRFPVTLSEPSISEVTVDYTLAGVTATGAKRPGDGVDFRDLDGVTRTVRFKVGGNGLTPTRKVVAVPVYPDTVVEGDETFTVTLSNPTGGYEIGRGVGTGTIIDDDPTGGLSFAMGDTSVVEGDEGRRVVHAVVSLSEPVSEEVLVDVVISGGTATCQKVRYNAIPAGVDCNDLDGKVRTLRFRPNATGFTPVFRAVAVQIYPDLDVEGDETVLVTLSNARPANLASSLEISISRPVGTITIHDDD